MLTLKFIVLSSLFFCGHCYNFLGVFPIPIKSHMEVFGSLMKELARIGHNVTVVSAFPEKNFASNYRDIDLSEHVIKLVEVKNITTEDSDSKILKYIGPTFVSMMADSMCESLSSRPYQNFLMENESYDAIIIENFNSDCFLSIAHKIKAPIIGFSSSGLLPWTYQRYGIPNNPAYIPEVFMGLTDKMNFFERLENTVVLFLHNLHYTFYRLFKDKQVVKKFVDYEATDLESYAKNSSLLLVNTHFTLNFARPLPPNAIEVGGIHIEEPKTLPTNLKKWIEDSPSGVIYFSMGSMTRGQSFPKNCLNDFIEAFELLPQKVVWKWENQTMEGKTEKILIQKWLPQIDLLCHPNVKLFISHGGLLGLMEAVYCGVPVVVMPIYGDQHSNAKGLEATGAAVILHMSEITIQTAYTSMLKALQLSNKMKILSNQFKDRPISPLQAAVYWTEYIVRHNGARNMQTAAVDMPFYQYYLLDVLLFICIILIAACYCLFNVVKLVIKYLDVLKVTKHKKE